MSNETRDPFTDDEIKAAVEADGPQEAFVMLIGLFQRAVIALEGIHAMMEEEGPVVLFEAEEQSKPS